MSSNSSYFDAGAVVDPAPMTMWSQLPLWRVAALLGFFGVGVVLNTTWFVKIVKGAYKVLFGSSQKKQA